MVKAVYNAQMHDNIIKKPLYKQKNIGLFDSKWRNVLVISKFDIYLSEVFIKTIEHI